MKKARDYKHEYALYGSKHSLDRSKCNIARRKMGLKVGDPREVDHKTSLADGGSNAKSNLRIVSRATNRKKAKHSL